MKLTSLCLVVCLTAAFRPVQSAAQDTGTSVPNSDATLNYIHGSWDSLTRSMTDCPSLVDPKVSESPVLYLPSELPLPSQVAALQQECHVRVQALPRRIEMLADLKP